MDPDGGHLRQQDEVAGETMAMAAAAAAVAASGTGTVGEKGKGKRIWVADEEPSNPTDDLMLDVDGDDLIFPDDAFSCLVDFPCLASVPESPLSSSARDRFKNTNLASSSSSSSSSNWSLLFGPTGGLSGGADAQAVASSSVDAMMLPPLLPTSDQLSIELEGLDALGDIDLDLSEPWGTASPTPDNMIIEDGATTASMSGEESPPRLHVMAGEERPPGGVGVEGGAATGSPMAVPEEEYSKEMVRVFFEWLRINRDTISPQDLREIRLKRATIDCAERRLGGNRRGRVQLLKLILAWVQASLLQKKKRRKSQNERQDRAEGAAPPYAQHHHHHQPPPPPFASPPHHHVPVLSSNVLADPNPNLDYNSQSNGWIPYQVDPTTGAVFPVLMPAYGGAGGGIISGGDLAYPGAAAAPAPYSYQHGSTSIIAVNYQPFPPSPDLHAVDDTTAAWPPPYAAAPVQYVAFPGATGPHPAPVPQTQYSRGYVNQYPGHPRLGGLGSATKEARKKRMARQRRASPLHHHRNQLQQKHHKAESRSSRAPAEGASSSSSNANDERAWSFWFSPSSSRQKNPVTESPPPPKSPMQQPQPSPSSPRQRQNSHGDEASTAERQQGWQGEKNLRFLLQKVLKQSDVGSLGRIVLPKHLTLLCHQKEAETHLPELESRDGITIPMEDIGNSQVWNMRYRFWPNNKSRMYLLENTGEFVRSNGLEEGDFIVIYSDTKSGKYMIRGVKVRQQQEPRGQTNRSVARGHLKRSRREKGSSSRTRASSSYDNINDDQGMSSSTGASSAASVPFMLKMETSP